MSIVVNWERVDGQAAWHRVGDVNEATAFVEHLRNVEGVETTRIFRLEPVPFEWHPYDRAEVDGPVTFTATIVGAPAPVVEPPVGAPPVVAPPVVAVPAVPAPVVEPEPEPVRIEPVRRAPWLTSVPEPPLDDLDPGMDVEPELQPTPGRRGLFGR